MIAFALALAFLVLYILFKKDILGLFAVLCIVWGMSRYAGTSPKPLWDPN
jgi:hypothetical protein